MYVLWKTERKQMKLEESLIISYSYSGNTHRLAEQIQAVTQGNWMEIYPRQPYPVTFPELLEQVKQEVTSGFRPPLLPGAVSCRPYPIVFAGSPNWCGTIAPPLASWLYKNDLKGKIVLPFYSHCGGVVGDFQRDILRLCPKADVREALGIVNDGGKELTETIRRWLARNGFSEETTTGGSENEVYKAW